MAAPVGARIRYSDADRANYIARRQQGASNRATCEDMRINPKTGDRWWHEWQKKQTHSGIQAANPPKTVKQIRQNAKARRAYDDFAYFRLKVFGAKTPPWATEAVERLRASVEEGKKSFLCMNVFPGAGKTLLFQHFICWMIARNRNIRVIWLAASDEMATSRVRWIRQELNRTEPWGGDPDDMASGRAQKPDVCMTDLFGRFRPSAHHGTPWRAGEFTVSTASDASRTDEGPPATGPTLLAVGPDSRDLLGRRANLIVADDIWTKAENDNPDLGRKAKNLYERTVTSRLQPNGTLALVMQRLGPNDLTRYVLNKQRQVRDPDSGATVGWEPVYQHIVYPAHHDDLCGGTHPDRRPAWDPADPRPGHCLTDPLALPPDDYLAVVNTPSWLVEYQQRDTNPATAIFREIWLTGGTDEDRQQFKGCLDLDRGLWELPEGLPKAGLASAVAIDVGHENYWGLYASVHSVAEETEWVLAAQRRRMPAGTADGLLDWDFERHCWVGLLEDWYQRSKALGVPFTHVVAEINAAQRHLFRRTNVIDRWQLQRTCRVITHDTTGRNKNDPKLSIEALLAIRYQLGAVRLPWRPGEAQSSVRPLYDQLVGYTRGMKEDDVLMAAWMRTLNRKRVQRPVEVDTGGGEQMPPWVLAMAR